MAVERTCKREQVVCRGYVLGDASARHVLVRSSILTCTAAVGHHGFLFCIVARGYSEQEYVFVTVEVHVDSAGALLGQFYWKTAKVATPGVELLCWHKAVHVYFFAQSYFRPSVVEYVTSQLSKAAMLDNYEAVYQCC